MCLDADKFYPNSDEDTGDNKAGDNIIVKQRAGPDNTVNEHSDDNCNEESKTVDVGRGAGSCNDGEIQKKHQNNGIMLMMMMMKIRGDDD